MGRSSVFSLEQVYRRQLTKNWTDIFDPFIYVKGINPEQPAQTAGPAMGYWAGGSYGSVVDRVDFSNDTPTASPRGPLSVGRTGLGNGGSTTSYGYAFAGSPGPKSSVDRIDYSNDTATSIAYRFLSHFEIQHTFPSVNNAAQGSNWSKVRDINGNATTITFSNVDAGTYTMRIRAVNTEGAHSPWNEITREIFSIPPGTSRIARVPRGGFLTFSPEIDASTGLVSIDATAYRYIHPSGEQYIFNPASTAQLQQSFSTLPAGQSAFWVFNASGTSDPWLKYYC